MNVLLSFLVGPTAAAELYLPRVQIHWSEEATGGINMSPGPSFLKGKECTHFAMPIAAS